MTQYYPGSKTPVKEYDALATPSTGRSAETYLDFISSPRTSTLNGRELKFYTIGELARLLNRKPVTIRKWEADGIIPKATFIAPSGDKRGKRRLYTKEQIVGLVDIAQEEGVWEPNVNGAWKNINNTKFREKALALFQRLAQEYKQGT